MSGNILTEMLFNYLKSKIKRRKVDSNLDANQRISASSLYRLLEREKIVPHLNFNRIPSPQINKDVDYLDKFKGALIGVGIGDAMGAPVEGWPPDRIKKPVREYRTKKYSSRPKGDITDDTRLTMFLADSYIACGRLYLPDLAKRFVSETVRGSGRTYKAFVENFSSKKMRWYETGIESPTNGSAMRVSPAGLMNIDNYHTLKAEAALQCMMTHNDRMAIASSIVQGLAVAELTHLIPGTIEDRKYGIIDGLAMSIRGIEGGRYKDRNGIPTSLYKRIAEEMKGMLSENPLKVRAVWNNRSYVLESLPFALYSFLRTPDNFEETLYTAVNAGHDADTVASMACALSGAYLGYRNIPKELVDGLLVSHVLKTQAKSLYDLKKNELNSEEARKT
ncbi:ADP-ribosylglycohydrolase family protein [Thermodesulfobacteriota bacterium]